MKKNIKDIDASTKLEDFDLTTRLWLAVRYRDNIRRKMPNPSDNAAEKYQVPVMLVMTAPYRREWEFPFTLEDAEKVIVKYMGNMLSGK